MARIRPITKDRAAMILRNLYDALEKDYGAAPAVFQTMAHRPELLLTYSNFHRELWTGGGLDAKTKALVALRAAALTGDRYSISFHSEAAKRAGVPAEQAAALHQDNWESSRQFDDRLQAAVRLAEKLTRAPASVSDDDLERLRKWFGDANLVELALLIGSVNLTSRVAQAFALAPDAAK
jgi:uncharacterized peroxidase-related enzyme